MASSARTIEDLERKYDFAKLLGLANNVKMQSKSIIKVENELLNMLNSLIINLKDVLNSQSEVSLWFYSGTPTTSNKPYIDWTTPSEHDGDIYYDQATGYVYQYKHSTTSWVLNTDTNLIQAMVMTNVEIDTESDHERKVYFEQPSPPYSSGDWWIKTDGSLFVCQLGRTTGTYHDDDFIVATKYTPTVASADGDVITVKRGQVIKMSDVFASFTDLATGGSTIINGANISTGTISTDNVSIGNDNVIINHRGIFLGNGADIISADGLRNLLQYNSINQNGPAATYVPAGYGIIGFKCNTEGAAVINEFSIDIPIYIPPEFKIEDARIILQHTPIFADGQGTSAPSGVWGSSQKIKLFKKTGGSMRTTIDASEAFYLAGETIAEITDAFGTNGWTPDASQHTMQAHTSGNFKNALSSGVSILRLATGNSAPAYNPDITVNVGGTQWPVNQTNCLNQTGCIRATVYIYGHMKYTN